MASASPVRRTPAQRARRAALAAYAAQGLGFAVVLTSIPSYEDRFGLGDGVVTLMILGVCVAAATGSAVSGPLSTRVGADRVVRGGLALGALAVAGIGLAPVEPLFLAAVAVYGIALGTVDAATTMVGIGVERAHGRSLLASFFAANAAGGVVGALLVSAATGLGSARAACAVAALAMAAVVAAVRGLGALGRSAARAPGPSVAGPTGPTAAASPPRRAMVRPGVIVVLGVAMLAYPVGDSATSGWAATYIRDVLDGAAVFAPWGYGAYQGTLIVSRLLGDRWVERFGRVRVVRVGGSLGAVGLLATALAPAWPVAVVGLAATGLGLGVVAPLAFSAAGDRAREAIAASGAASSADAAAAVSPVAADVAAATDHVVSRLNVFTYVGAVLGGVLTGVFATADHFRAGFVVLAGLAAVSAVLAPVFRSGSTTAVRARRGARREAAPAGSAESAG